MSFDLSKVTGAVKKMVDDIKKLDGEKKEIDSQKELNQLANLLANTSAKGDKEYIEGLMIEYQTKEIQKAQENARTEDGQKLIKKAKKILGDKKKLDQAAEAQMLVAELKNPNTYLSAQDKLDIVDLIYNSGFGYLLEEEPKNTTVNVNVVVVNPPENENTNSTTKPAKKEEVKPQPAVRKNKAPKSDIPDVDKSDVPKNEQNETPNVDKPDTLKTPAKSNIPEGPHKIVITEHQREVGTAAADTIMREVDSFVADNDEIDRALADIEVSPFSAFSFVGKFILQAGHNAGVNQTVFSVSDPKDKLTYTDTLKVMKALLKQAERIGLKEYPAYKQLQQEIQHGDLLIRDNGAEYNPSDNAQLNADKALNWLYNEMKPYVE